MFVHIMYGVRGIFALLLDQSKLTNRCHAAVAEYHEARIENYHYQQGQQG